MAREKSPPPVFDCAECGRSYIHAMTCSKYAGAAPMMPEQIDAAMAVDPDGYTHAQHLHADDHQVEVPRIMPEIQGQLTLGILAFPKDCEHARQANSLPHADASEAEASFAEAVGLGLIDLDGNLLCDCPKSFDPGAAPEMEAVFNETTGNMEIVPAEEFTEESADRSYPNIYDHNCTLCPLHAGAQTVCVAGKGPTDAEIMVVVQNPGAQEDNSGDPFIGPASTVLDRILLELGIESSRVVISNAVKCVTPGNREPNKKESAACAHYLVREIAFYQPKILVLMGNAALKMVTTETKITQARGKAATFNPTFLDALIKTGINVNEIFVLPTMHPSAVIHSPKGEQVRAQITDDLRLAVNEATDSFNEIPVPWKWETQSADVLKKYALAIPDLEKAVWSADIEANDLPVWHPDYRVMMISIDTGYDPIGVFRGRDLLNAVELLRFVHEKGTTVVGHNWSGYDRAALEERTKINIRGDDTMLIEHLLHEDGPKGLQDIATRRLKVRPWKDELPENVWKRMTTGDFSAEEWERLGLYNARDTRYTRLVFLDQMTEMANDLKLFNYYKAFFNPFARALSRIERNGIFVSLDKISKEWGKYAIQKKRGETAARLLTGDPDFNPGSSKQVRELLFDKLRLPAQQWTDAGDESTNEFSLKKLKWLVETAGQNDETLPEALPPQVPALVNAILDYRGAVKYEGTYLGPYAEMALASPITSRIFPSYSLVSSVSRTASFNPNTQNRPRDLDIIGAAPGKVIVHADASQLELRTIAQCSGSKPMIDALNQGLDLHAELAIAIRKLRGDPNPSAFTPEERSRAKPGNFGFGYGADEYTFEVIALKDYDMVVPRSESTLIRSAFHERWQLRPWYERQFKEATDTGMVRSLSGRLRHLPAIHSSDAKIRLEALRQAINFPAQELGLTIWGCVLILAIGMGIPVTQQIHDSLDAEVTPEQVDETVAKMRSIEAAIPTTLKNLFGIDLLVPFIIDVEIDGKKVPR